MLPPKSLKESQVQFLNVSYSTHPDQSWIPAIADNPSERYFGETGPLFEPPDIHFALKKNTEVPPLQGQELTDALQTLQSGYGIDTDKFWCLFDKCDCTLWVRKDTYKLHLEKYCSLTAFPSSPITKPSSMSGQPSLTTDHRSSQIASSSKKGPVSATFPGTWASKHMTTIDEGSQGWGSLYGAQAPSSGIHPHLLDIENGYLPI